jgi:hypothetical protein
MMLGIRVIIKPILVEPLLSGNPQMGYIWQEKILLANPA